MKWQITIIGIVLLLLCFPSYSETINIAIDGSGDFLSIQAGIEAANDSDTVLVAPGTYYEDIDFLGKEILVASWFITSQDTSYISTTLINGLAVADTVVTIENLETDDLVLSGFSIITDPENAGFGIYINGGASPRIEYCHISLELGSGIYVDQGNPVISSCEITGTNEVWSKGIFLITYSDASVNDCRVSGFDVGLAVYYRSRPIIENCSFTGNFCGVYIESLSRPVLNNCLLADNFGPERFAFELTNESMCFLRNCTIAGNTNDSGPLLCSELSLAFLINCVIINDGVADSTFNWSCLRYTGCTLDYEILPEEDLGLNTNWSCLLTPDYQLGEASPCIDTAIAEFDYQEDIGEVFPVDFYGGVYFNIEDFNGLRPDRGFIESDIPASLYSYFYVDENIVCAGIPLQFHDFSTGNIDAWEWDFENDGIIDSYDQHPIHIYDETGVYSVALNVNDTSESNTLIEQDYITVTGQQVHNLTQNTWHSLISQGITYAGDGDTLIVYPGIYQEELDFQDKALILRSLFAETHNEDDITSTIIEPLSPILLNDGINGFEITGFSLRNSPGTVLEIDEGCNGLISDCLFYNNGEIDINNEGVISISSAGEIQIINCTIADNQDFGIKPHYADIVLLNTILYGNENGTISTQYDANYLIFNCNIEDYENLSILNNMIIDEEYGALIDVNSCFTDPEVYNYTLADSSACINAGTSYFEYNNTIYLDMTPEEYHGSAPDIGAYESCFVAINADDISPDKTGLKNYPNPFNPETTIRYDLSNTCHVLLEIYNIKGQKITTLVDGYYEAGSYESIWNASDQSSGIYLIRYQTDDIEEMKKIILLK